MIGATIAALLGTGCEWHFETLDGYRIGPNGEAIGEAIEHPGSPFWDKYVRWEP